MDKYLELINELRNNRYITSKEIYDAFIKIRRRDFLSPADRDNGHVNAPIPIGYGQTNSQPLTVAFMLELLEPKPGQRILDIGCGSGWTTALLSQIAGPQGKVYGLDIIPELVDAAVKNIAKYNFIAKNIADIALGDGYKGLPDQAPFDRILISAAAPELPMSLTEQLMPKGIMVVPAGSPDGQAIYKLTKSANNKIEQQIYPGFVFVPLVNIG